MCKCNGLWTGTREDLGGGGGWGLGEGGLEEGGEALGVGGRGGGTGGLVDFGDFGLGGSWLFK